MVVIFFACSLLGTIIGAILNEHFTLQWLLGSIILSPISLIIRIAASLGSIFPNIGISVWTNHFWNAIDIFCIFSSVTMSVFYFKTKNNYWLIAFGISFALLNFGNMNQFVAMMSI